MSPEDFRTLGWKSGQRQRARYDTEAMASREKNDHPFSGTPKAVDDDYREFLLWDVAGAFWSLPLREREKIAGALVAGEDLGEVWRDQMRIVGILEAKRTTLVRLLTLKFGPLNGGSCNQDLHNEVARRARRLSHTRAHRAGSRGYGTPGLTVPVHRGTARDRSSSPRASLPPTPGRNGGRALRQSRSRRCGPRLPSRAARTFPPAGA